MTEQVGTVLTWEYAEAPNYHQYHLRKGEQVLSVLRLEHMKQYDAVVEIGGERYLIEKHVTAPYHLVVRKEGVEAVLMRFDADMKATGLLTLADGRTLTWAHPSILVPEWDFEDSDGRMIVDVKAKFGFQRPQAKVTLGPERRETEEVVLLAALGWYITLITNLYPTYIFSR